VVIKHEKARQVATDRRHTFGAAAMGRAMLSNQNNSVSVCDRVTMRSRHPVLSRRRGRSPSENVGWTPAWRC